MDEKLEIPEERYMRNTIVIDEMGGSSGFESLLRGEKQNFTELICDSHSTYGEPQFRRREDCMTQIKSTKEVEQVIMSQVNTTHSQKPTREDVPNDDDYFASLDPEQIKWYEEYGPEISSFNVESTVNCTSCNKPVQIQIGSANGIRRHPLLGVVICTKCRKFYKDGIGWKKDEDGCDMYCRWCGEGGELIVCDKCPAAFCKRCIQRNLGREIVVRIKDSNDWGCFVCNPQQIYEHKARYYSLYRLNKIPGFQTMPYKPKNMIPGKRKSDALFRKAEHIIHSSQHFIDENIGQAFKTLSVYQKCLEKERKNWIKKGRQMDEDIVAKICRSLRRIYAITKQNMELLDRALLQSFTEQFPSENEEIAIDNVGLRRLLNYNTKQSNNKKSAIKRKRKPAKKKTRDTIIIKGRPIYADPNDINNNKESSVKKVETLEKQTSLYPLHSKKKAVRQDSGSDWSDFDVTL